MDIKTSRSYRILGSIMLAVGVALSLLGTVLLATLGSSDSQGAEAVGMALLKIGIALVLGALVSVVIAAYHVRQRLSRGLKITIVSLLVLCSPVIVGLALLLVKL